MLGYQCGVCYCVVGYAGVPMQEMPPGQQTMEGQRGPNVVYVQQGGGAASHVKVHIYTHC